MYNKQHFVVEVESMEDFTDFTFELDEKLAEEGLVLASTLMVFPDKVFAIEVARATKLETEDVPAVANGLERTLTDFMLSTLTAQMKGVTFYVNRHAGAVNMMDEVQKDYYVCPMCVEGQHPFIHAISEDEHALHLSLRTLAEKYIDAKSCSPAEIRMLRLAKNYDHSDISNMFIALAEAYKESGLTTDDTICSNCHGDYVTRRETIK